MVYGTQITIVTGANLNQLITGGPHIVVETVFTAIDPYTNLAGQSPYAYQDQAISRPHHSQIATDFTMSTTHRINNCTCN